ncbi:unnamed protein product [Danaus chrysippus]|uniref:(African queen) hypothetical protein n=1 Tax=Danaus chrysippus TaxID=151541 RepID=A0A8J2QJ43_9NEOP|nr:unnamed protein product [Danaus chrysippus]
MGAFQSKYPGLTEDLLEEYTLLTYLNKGQILYLMKKFHSINPEKISMDYNYRVQKQDIIAKFEVLRNNPFQDRLFRVFSSQQDGCFSFEDLLDLCSAMSPDCPAEVKAAWAFRIFDIDEDNQITPKDICNILDRITWDPNNRTNFLTHAEKMKIADTILEKVNLDKSGSVGLAEFRLMITRIPEFTSSFYFRL